MVRASLLAEYSALQPSILTFPDVFVFVFLVFRDRVFLYSPGCPGTYSVDQAVFKLRELPPSASRVLGLKTCAHHAQPQPVPLASLKGTMQQSTLLALDFPCHQHLQPKLMHNCNLKLCILPCT